MTINISFDLRSLSRADKVSKLPPARPQYWNMTLLLAGQVQLRPLSSRRNSSKLALEYNGLVTSPTTLSLMNGHQRSIWDYPQLWIDFVSENIVRDNLLLRTQNVLLPKNNTAETSCLT